MLNKLWQILEALDLLTPEEAQHAGMDYQHVVTPESLVDPEPEEPSMDSGVSELNHLAAELPTPTQVLPVNYDLLPTALNKVSLSSSL
jgi:hypothetical protein